MEFKKLDKFQFPNPAGTMVDMSGEWGTYWKVPADGEQIKYYGKKEKWVKE